ncbi:LysR family transcriptional regulator [Acidisoma cellulosilytica]|uniref:LysR family transcriptional regulator n=1 Tax=Acidisoma cellulosilyticum TaxID=2802395 RepID=A0A963Z0R2_9PROT|nr:LysR family transcriptional regulator [Acidisoma cellulosilyticum]MCB8879882.1 LysR family transcriptional regulator [Acidisoma cellulosilyticum]
MTLRQLEILRALVLHRTTVAAAQDLGLSQPAISNALKAMETQAGFALFERVNNRLHPTPEGMTLFRESEAIFSLHARLEGRLRDLRDSRSGQLRIVATPPVASGIIPPALKQLLHTRPRLQVFFDVRRFEGVVEAVLSHVAELGFVLGFSGQPGLGSEVLHAGEMVCVCPPGHPLSQLSEVSPADLTDYPLIGLERGTRLGDALRRSFHSVDVTFRPSVEVRYCNTACTLAASGVGVAIVDPFSAHQGDNRQLAIRPFRPVTPVKAHVLWSEARPLSRTCQTFIREVRQAARTDGLLD